MSGPQVEPSIGIRILLLGAPRWERPAAADMAQRGRSELAHGGALAPRDAALLALLAIDGVVARDRVAAWLWPEAASQAKANLSLRQRLFRLRRVCGHALVEAGQSLSLAEGVQVDLHQQPVPTQGLLLAGQDFGAFEGFDEWVGAARDTVGRRQADALTGEAAALQEQGRLAEAIAVCERIVAQWPATEHAWRRLMRLHWARADRAAAIAAFERFEQQVCREWGLRPSAETLALLSQIESGEASLGGRQGPGGAQGMRSPRNARPDGRAEEQASLQPAPLLAGQPDLRRDTTGQPVGLGPPGTVPSALPASLLHPPMLVGREAALGALSAAWEAGRAVLVLAPGGLGKSRLLEAACGDRAGMLQLRARPGDAQQPYATMARALDEALTRFAPSLDAQSQAELSRLLPRLGPAPSAPAQQPMLWTAVQQAWLAIRARGLQVLVWDDLHWADAATLDLLHHLLADAALSGLPLALAARPDEDTEAARRLPLWLGDSLRVQPVVLMPWSEHDLTRLLPSLGLPAALSEQPGLPAELMCQTGGQPFFVLETLKTLLMALTSGTAPAPAPAVHAVIARRVLRLDDAQRRLLQLLAVAGDALPLPVAAAVLRQPLVDLAGHWSVLGAAQLVGEHGLAHDLVRESVLAGLPLPARRALQLALAGALAVRPGIDPARLAALWQAGEAWPEAADGWCRAALAAVRTGRLDEAEALFDRADAAASASGDAALQVAVQAGAQPTRLLRLGPEAVVARLSPLLPEVQATEPRVRLLLLLAEAELSRMQPAAADAAAAEAMALCDALAADAHAEPVDPPLAAHAALMHGRTLAWTGHAEAGVQLLHAACERAEANGDVRQRLLASGTLADVLVAAGRRAEAARVQERTMALARSLGDRMEVAVAASNLAVYSLLVGDAAASLAAAREALGGFAAMGVAHVNRPMCAGVHALAAAHAGRFDLAVAEALPLAGDPGEPTTDPVRLNLRTTLANLALWRGRADEAARWLPPLDDAQPLSIRLTGLFARLRWAAATGGDDRAERAALSAIGLAHPGLRDDAHYYRAWAPWDPPQAAVARLDALAKREQQAGAAGTARALAVVALQILLQTRPPEPVPVVSPTSDPLPWQADIGHRARALAPVLQLGLHPALSPAEAAWAVAQGLRLVGDLAAAEAARMAAVAWVDAAVLPEGPVAAAPDGPSTELQHARRAFAAGHAVHRALMAGWPEAGPSRAVLAPN